ncbi:hypothetical protein [Streptomyces sp. NPDC001135]
MSISGDDVVPVGLVGRTFGYMHEVPRRIGPSTDRATAALMLGCSPNQVGYCARCQGPTQRYGNNAQLACRACRAAEAANGSSS